MSCAQELPDGAKFCLHCGQPQTATACASCGAPLVAGSRFCMECGTPTGAAPPQPTVPHPSPVASRRLTSILFGDLVGFTTLSESRDPEEVRELLARYFEECSRVISRYGGTVEKFIGDAVMAVWGVPTAHEDDAERAVRAGLELVAAVHEFGEEVGAPDLTMRVGITTSEVAVTVGATQQGMVAGDAVNTAARIQSTAEPGHVWVDESTKLLTAAAISYADAGRHALKGKAEPVPLWAVRAVVAAIGGAQRADGLEAPLVGRDRELRLVKELFHQSEESRRPTLLIVDGEPGVGKTRLAWEFEKYVDGFTSPVRWHSGRCVAYGEGVAYFALAEAVRGRLQVLTDHDSPLGDSDAALLARTLDTHVSDPEERAWIRERLGALVGIGSVGTFQREDLFAAWVTFFERVGGGFPVTLVIDDAQHADEGMLTFIEHLLTTASFGCFVVLLTRPGLLEEHPSLVTHRQTNVVHIPTLSQADVAAMLDGLVTGLPDELRDKLVTRAEGVPLFAVETVRSLIDRDLVVPREGQYVLSSDAAALDIDSLAAPASLQALIAARLDTLTDGQRALLDRASVVGASFSTDTISALCRGVVPDPERVLQELIRLQLLARESSRMSSEYGNYRFVQSAVRQVAYGSLSRRDRKSFHLALVPDASTPADDDAAAIYAQHYLAAIDAVPGDPDVPHLQEAALAHLRHAAARARSLGSPAEAAKHLEAAIALTDHPAVLGALHRDLAQARFDGAEWESAIEHGNEALRQLEGVGDRWGAGHAAALVSLAHALGLGNSEAGLAVADPWWEELRHGDEDTRTLLLLSRAMITSRNRLRLDIRELVDTRIRIAERTGSTAELGETYNMLAVYFQNAGAPETASLLLTAAADVARRNHDLRTLALALVNLAAESSTKDLARAVAAAREAHATAVRVGDAYMDRFSLANLALGLYAVGDWADLDETDIGKESHNLVDESVEAILTLRAIAQGRPRQLEPLEELTDVDDQMINGWRAFVESVHSLHAGDESEALRHGVRALQLIHGESDVWDDLPHLWAHVATLALRLAAQEELDTILGLVAGSGGFIPLSLDAHYAYVSGLLAIRDHRDEEVEPLLRKAMEGYTTWGSRVYRAWAEAALGQWHLDRGSVEEGDVLLAAARATYTDLGATRWLAELDGVPQEAP